MIIHFAAKEKIGQENKHMDEQSNAYADCGMLLMKETLFQFCKASKYGDLFWNTERTRILFVVPSDHCYCFLDVPG